MADKHLWKVTASYQYAPDGRRESIYIFADTITAAILIAIDVAVEEDWLHEFNAPPGSEVMVTDVDLIEWHVYSKEPS